jgi:hypothetical protein
MSRQRDRLQTRGAKPVDRHAADRHRQARFERNLPRDVGTGGALRVGAAHDDVFNFSAFNAGTRNRVLHRVAAEGGTVGHVERALPAFGQRGAGGRNNDGSAHACSPWASVRITCC